MEGMTQEESKLLIVDLSGRVPYGLKVSKKIADYDSKTFEECVGELWDIGRTGSNLVNVDGIDYRSFSLDFKPFLRPLSSMTDDEKNELKHLGGIMSYNPSHNTYALAAYSSDAFDWLDEKMFDYRYLIPKGLALEAPEGMYNN